MQRFEHRDARAAPNLLVVAVDDKTFADTGYHWPFQRRRHAQAIDRLRRAGARVIVYDVQFTEQTTARDDNALITAVDKANNVVLATAETDEKGHSNVLGGDAFLHSIGAEAAASNLPEGRGGRAAARGVRARRPADAGHGRRPAHGPPDQGLVLRERRRLDRLPRPAGDDRHRLVLRPARREGRPRARARARRRRRRGVADAAGRAPDADERQAHVRPRDRGQRHRHRPARHAAARDPALGRAAHRPGARLPARAGEPAPAPAGGRGGGAGDRVRLPLHRPARLRPRSHPARGHAALRARAGDGEHHRRGLRRRAPPALPRHAAQRRARGGRARADGRAARDPARGHPPPGPGHRVARPGDRHAPRAHQPHVRAPRAGAGHDRDRGRDAAQREPAARRGQDRRARRDPAAAGLALAGGSRAHAPPHDRGLRAVVGLELRGHAHGRGDRPHPPRALGRRRLPGRPGRRADPARGAHLRGVRRLRRAALRPALQGAVACSRRRSTSCAASAASTSTRPWSTPSWRIVGDLDPALLGPSAAPAPAPADRPGPPAAAPRSG